MDRMTNGKNCAVTAAPLRCTKDTGKKDRCMMGEQFFLDSNLSRHVEHDFCGKLLASRDVHTLNAMEGI